MMFKHCSILPRVCEMTAGEWFHNIPVPVTLWDGGSQLLARGWGERVSKGLCLCSLARMFFESLVVLTKKSLFSRNTSQPKCGLELWGWIPAWCVQGRGQPVPQAAGFHPWAAAGTLLLPVTSVLDPSGRADSRGLWSQRGQKKYNNFLWGRNSFCAVTNQIIIKTTLMTEWIYVCRPSRLFLG